MTDSTGVRHTAGPWLFRAKSNTVHTKGEPPYTYGPRIFALDDDDAPMSDADRNLVLAAPDLLAAAQAMMARWPTDQHDGSPLKDEADALRAAIARAKEGQP